jgi:HD-GYP domain-containing protein (c-di-GMP phosphodiesterase class II)
MDAGTRRILVLDDDLGAAAPLELLLRRHGYDGVDVRADVDGALRDLRLVDADLVVIHDPRAAVPARPPLPLLVLGRRDGHPDPEGVSVIARPLDVRAFLAAVEDLLAGEPSSDRQGDVIIDLREGAKERVRYCDAGVLERLRQALVDTDPVAAERSDRVAQLAGALAIAADLDEHSVGRIRAAARFCDIGLLGVPVGAGRTDRDDTEPNWYRLHPELGAALLRPAEGDVARLAGDIALRHHEHWDGNGCPDGLTGDAIPLAARIVAVADAFVTVADSVGGPLDDPWLHRMALGELRAIAGQQLDPELVELLPLALEHLGEIVPL